MYLFNISCVGDNVLSCIWSNHNAVGINSQTSCESLESEASWCGSSWFMISEALRAEAGEATQR